MACCEKCWADAYIRARCDTSKSQAEHYPDILREREEAGMVCTPKEQAGQWWDEERQVDTAEEGDE